MVRFFATLFQIASSALLIIVSVLAAFMPELLQKRLTTKVRVGLCVLFSVVGIGGAIFNIIQNITQEQRFIGEATGGDTYCYFVAIPNMGAGDPPTYPLLVFVKGTYPMRNTVAEFQTVYDDSAKQLASIRTIPLGDGTLLPGLHPIDTNFRVPIGKHFVRIWSRSGMLNQSLDLSVSNGELKQTGELWGNGKKLEDISKPNPFPERSFMGFEYFVQYILHSFRQIILQLGNLFSSPYSAIWVSAISSVITAIATFLIWVVSRRQLKLYAIQNEIQSAQHRLTNFLSNYNERKSIYNAALDLLDKCISNTPITHEDVSSFNRIRDRASILFDEEINRYLFDAIVGKAHDLCNEEENRNRNATRIEELKNFLRNERFSNTGIEMKFRRYLVWNE